MTRHPRDGNPWYLDPRQEALRDTLITAANPHRGKPWLIDGYLLGVLVEPAHVEEGVYPVPERRHVVYYVPGYGIVAQSLCTSNGSAAMIAQCTTDRVVFVPAVEAVLP